MVAARRFQTQILDKATSSSGKSMDNSGVCSETLNKAEACKMAVQESIDSMDVMLFQAREQLTIEGIRSELNAVEDECSQNVEFNVKAHLVAGGHHHTRDVCAHAE